ncbi:MAG: PEGA domain-containing protein [Sandaracinaceae bacterium]|nr:PEGA domain-containing protein [Sandaracinaceae bacterium]
MNTRGQARVALFLVLFTSLQVAGLASAQDTAATLVEQGLDLREQGDDEGALARFEAAYRLDPSPRTLAQIALAEMATSRWLQAEEHLTQALATQHEWIETNRVALNGAMAGIRDHIGRLQVEATPEGAELWIGGQRVGTLPLPAPLPRDPGDIEIEIRADGYQTQQQSVRLVGGQITRLVVALQAEGGDEPELVSADDATGTTSSGGGGLSIPGIVVLAVGGAAMVTGAVLLGVGFADKAALESPDGMPTWTESEQARADQVPVLVGAGEVALFAGAAAVVAGVVLLIVDGGGGDSQASLRNGRVEVRF